MSQNPPRPNSAALAVQPAEYAPPHNTEHEQALCACMLMLAEHADKNADKIERTAQSVSPEAFYWPQFGAIYAAVCDLQRSDAPVTSATVYEWLQQQGKSFPGARDTVGSLYRMLPTTAGLDFYAGKVKEKAKLRDLDAAGAEIRGYVLSDEYEDVEQRIAAAEKRIFAVASAGGPDIVESASDIRSLLLAETEAIEYREKNGGALSGLSTGFRALDSILGGLDAGQMYILAGRPGMGKSAIGVQIAVNVAKNGAKVAIFSIEMPEAQLARRIIAAESGVHLRHLRTGQGFGAKRGEPGGGLSSGEWAAINGANNRLWDCQLKVDDTESLCPSLLASKARRLRAEMGGLDLVVVDHFHKMNTDPGVRFNGEVEELSSIARSLQKVIRGLGCAGLILAQLNRSVEKREDKHPVMSDLRGSGALEEEAAVIAFAYRASYYEKNDSIEGDEDELEAAAIAADLRDPELSEPERDEVEIHVEKHRDGEPGWCKLDFLPQTTKIENHRPPIECDADRRRLMQ